MIGMGMGMGMGVSGAGEGVASPPQNIVGVDLGGGNVELQWTDAPAAPNGYNWELFVDGGGIVTNGGAPFGSSPISPAASGVAPGNYYFRMQTNAYTGFAVSPWVDGSVFTVA